jgi:hypothetical protein
MEGVGDAKSPPGAAPRGAPPPAGGGAAGSSTARQVGQQHALDAYNKRLDSAVGKLNEHYANILKSAKVPRVVGLAVELKLLQRCMSAHVLRTTPHALCRCGATSGLRGSPLTRPVGNRSGTR